MSKSKLALQTTTLRKLTDSEAAAAFGGITGAAINPTGGDTRGVTLSVKWYAQKWTIGR